MLTGKFVVSGCLGAVLSLLAGPALAQWGGGGGGNGCGKLQTSWSQLQGALKGAVGVAGNGGLGNNMWGTLVDNSGIVCAVAFSGGDYTQQWLGSRVISAQKANTGNAFSLGINTTIGAVIALSSANLYSAVQPGGSLYGLQASNPVETDVAYGNSPGGQGNAPANPQSFGTPNDPLVGERVGGINVFGGGLALYVGGKRVGGLGVSGDTSCTDHMVAWRTRHTLGLDQFDGVGGVSGDPTHPDNIIFDITVNGVGVGAIGVSKSGFGHPNCVGVGAGTPTLSTLPPVTQ